MQKTASQEAGVGVDAFTLLHKDPEQPCHGKTFYGKFAEHGPRLRAYNDMGYNVFFTVNLTDGSGRRAENIVKARSLFADFDNGLPKQFILEPSLIVQSSPGKYQAYWTLDEWTTDLERWKRIERAMVRQLGADQNAQDLARVFRVPGMLNHKYPTPYRTNVTLATGKAYNLDTAALVFGEDAPARQEAGGGVVPADLPSMEERVKRGAAWVNSCIRRGGWPTPGNRNGVMYAWAAKLTRDFAVDGGDAEELLYSVWNLHDTTGDDPRIEQLVSNAERSASGVMGSAYAEPAFAWCEEDTNTLVK